MRDKSERRVYFIGTLDTAIKIGVTGSLDDRFASIQSCSPVPLELLADVRGGEALERLYHAWFDQRRLHGEWFSPDPEILAEIERLTHLQEKNDGR